MLNIVIVTPGFAIDENDTTCVPFLQLYILELLKQNIRVTIITTQYPASLNYIWNGIDVITLVKKEPKLISKILFNHRFNKALKSIYKKGKIDAIHHIWFNESVFISNQFAIKRQIKHITTFAGQDVLPENQSLANINSYNGSLVCVSLFQQLKFNERHHRKSEIIHWGIEAINFNNQPRPIDLICCGSVNEIKNQSQFVDIVYELSKKHLITKAVICGDGIELSAIDRKLQALNLGHIIEIRGNISRAEVIELMKQSKLLIHTSHYEGFGLVLIEGLASGCKVISKPVGVALNNQLMSVCNTTQEFVNEIAKQLQSTETIHKSMDHYPINETIINYITLYKS